MVHSGMMQAFVRVQPCDDCLQSFRCLFVRSSALIPAYASEAEIVVANTLLNGLWSATLLIGAGIGGVVVSAVGNLDLSCCLFGCWFVGCLSCFHFGR